MNDTSTPAVMAETLAELRVRFGDGAFTSRRRLLSLLADRMPDATREIKILALALEDGAVDTLRSAGPRLSLEIDRLCAAMESRHGTRPDIVRSVLTALASGLGLDTTTVSTPAAAADAGSDWLGASSVVATAPRPQASAPASDTSPPPPRSGRRSGLLVGVGVVAIAAVGWLVADRAGLLPTTTPPATEAPTTKPTATPAPAPTRPEPRAPKPDTPPAPPKPQPAPTPPPATPKPAPEPVPPPAPPKPSPEPVPAPPVTPKSSPAPDTEPQTPPEETEPSPPDTPSQPPVQMPNPGGTAALPPMLVPPTGAMPLPTLPVNETATDYGYFFSVPSGGPIPYIGLVMVSKTGGWAHAQFRAFVPSNGQTVPVFLSVETPFETVPFPQGAMRRMWVRRWVQNNVGVADVCIGVARANATEVPKHGFRLCLFLDGCQRMVGCGEVP